MKRQLLLTTKVWQEGNYYIAYTPELDVASQGKTYDQAQRRLKESVTLFLETAKKRGVLRQILREAGFITADKKWRQPSISISSLEIKV
ncbi:MAG: hypothetical protein A2939_01885 [Parcubacteria group bacterium RIFCSPLOWO2_01_FULL_48_18]|nr:MAG: hypothetical protein A2939_01885 [Parcubacteria group bacterium RIFCSPLOWO2_01_FULL_48_18]